MLNYFYPWFRSGSLWKEIRVRATLLRIGLQGQIKILSLHLLQLMSKKIGGK